MEFIIKTQKGLEGTAAAYIKEKLENADTWITPEGYSGLIILKTSDEKAREKLKSIPEIERTITVHYKTKSKIEKILEKAEKIAEHIKDGETFAVKTKRRGKHDFTSPQVNKKLGEKILQLANATVDLNFPEKIIQVEIIGENTYISIIKGEKWKKYTPEKENARKLFHKTTIIQMPYWGKPQIVKKFGEKIGRAAQAYEIKELIIAPKEKMDAQQIAEFIKGIKKGQKSRYMIQKEAYPWPTKEVPISLWDLYQAIRDKKRKKRTIIITDPKGKTINTIKENLKEDLRKSKEIIILIGSREGIPRGLFKFADHIIDLTPYITFATEHAIPATLTTLYQIYTEK
ncbi:MAG: SPOUT family RNA methylase [Methanothermobacter sp.]|nr:SPOUT family RNA methylase [Methanothermobacter sp.]